MEIFWTILAVLGMGAGVLALIGLGFALYIFSLRSWN